METWREIVDKLRDEPCEDGWFQLLADRIETACKTMEDVIIVEQEENDRIKKELKAKKVHLEGLVNDVQNKNVRICKKQFETLRLEHENAKLRRALEPVMECAVCKADGTPVADGEICTSSDYGVCDYEGNALDWHDVAECLDAVREAQAIAKGENLFTAKAKTRNNKGKIKNEHQ